MAWSAKQPITLVIRLAKQHLQQVTILQVEYDEALPRNLLKLAGYWYRYRVVVSQIYRPDGSIRYAYYLRHDGHGNIKLTEFMTFEMFLSWLSQINLQ